VDYTAKRDTELHGGKRRDTEEEILLCVSVSDLLMLAAFHSRHPVAQAASKRLGGDYYARRQLW